MRSMPFCRGSFAAISLYMKGIAHVDENLSLWLGTAKLPPRGKIDRDQEVDVAVVGGGITELTAALLLARAGRRVILLEKATVAACESVVPLPNITEAIDAIVRADLLP